MKQVLDPQQYLALDGLQRANLLQAIHRIGVRCRYGYVTEIDEENREGETRYPRLTIGHLIQILFSEYNGRDVVARVVYAVQDDEELLDKLWEKVLRMI